MGSASGEKGRILAAATQKRSSFFPQTCPQVGPKMCNVHLEKAHVGLMRPIGVPNEGKEKVY